MTVRLNVTEIRKQMAVKRLNNVKLADLAGISRQSIGAILTRGTCTIANAGRLADALGMDVEAIWIND